MKILPEKKALEHLSRIQDDFRAEVRDGYEHRAEPCAQCRTPGICCLDAHFVNVHISRLESTAIRAKLDSLDPELREKVEARIDGAVEEYRLTAEGDTYLQKFACPLFEKGIGCLIHHDGKPVACTVHACYENEADLPPDNLQAAQEKMIDDLNTRTYGSPQLWLPLPLALKRHV